MMKMMKIGYEIELKTVWSDSFRKFNQFLRFSENVRILGDITTLVEEMKAEQPHLLCELLKQLTF